MKDKLTKEEVLHVARLARIHVNEEEVEKYQIELKQLLNDIDKIKEVKTEANEMMFSPVETPVTTREDVEGKMLTFEEIKENVPNSLGNFVEVPVMINE